MSGPALVRIGVDSSYDGQYFAVVVGWQTDVDRLHRRICTNLGLSVIHMRQLAGKVKRAVVEEIRQANPSPSSIQIHCLRIEKQLHRKLVLHKRQGYAPTGKLYDSVDYCIGLEITHATSDSLIFFQVRWHDIRAEVDNDTERILEMAGVAVEPAGPAHQLADAVAWSNHNDISLPIVRHNDLTSVIDSRLRKRLKRLNI